MLDLHRLSLLRELAMRGTVTEVANSLNFAPSTVSAQLARLEKEAGTTLLVSSGRKLMLTTAALGLVEHTDKMLAIMEQATAELAEAETMVAGTVRVSMFQTSALALLPGTLELLRQTHPNIRRSIPTRTRTGLARYQDRRLRYCSRRAISSTRGYSATGHGHHCTR